MKDNEIKMDDYRKPTGLHKNHREDLMVIGFCALVLCLLMAIGIVGLLRLINP